MGALDCRRYAHRSLRNRRTGAVGSRWSADSDSGPHRVVGENSLTPIVSRPRKSLASLTFGSSEFDAEFLVDLMVVESPEVRRSHVVDGQIADALRSADFDTALRLREARLREIVDAFVARMVELDRSDRSAIAELTS